MKNKGGGCPGGGWPTKPCGGGEWCCWTSADVNDAADSSDNGIIEIIKIFALNFIN